MELPCKYVLLRYKNKYFFEILGNFMHEYVLTIDQGTSSTKIILYDTDGSILVRVSRDIRLIESTQGYIEQEPADILESITGGIEEVLVRTGIEAKSIVALALDNQGETIIPFRKSDLTPLYNAVSWQDGRGEQRIQQIQADQELSSYITDTTGLFPSSYFSASKMQWLVDNVEGVRSEKEQDNLLMATSEVWILNRLIRAKDRKFLSDYTTASRTMLLDLERLDWDERLVEAFHLTPSCMPEPVPTIYDFGTTDPKVCHGIEAPIVASVVDQQSALFGHRCYTRGEAKLTLGTGGFLQVHAGADPKNTSGAIIKSIFPHIGDKVEYIYEGQIYAVGSAIEWLKRNELISHYSDTHVKDYDPAKSMPFFIPTLSGVSAPYWKSEPFAAFLDMGLQTSKSDMVSSVIESIAFRAAQIITLTEKETGIEIVNLSIDGGVSKNPFILQMISKLTGKRIVKPANEDLTSLGGFFLASLRLGLRKNYDDLLAYDLESQCIEESIDPSLKQRFARWEELFERIVQVRGEQ
jgi:glycerol kinase